MNHSFKIYGLKDPITKQLRYVGQTKQERLKNRFNYHVNEKTNTRKNQWIRSLRKKGLLPEMFVIDECYSLDELNELEIFWIAYFKYIGCRLTNVSSGGGGMMGIKQSPETIAKRAAKQVGTKRTEECKKRMSELAKNRGESFKRKMSEIGKSRSAEYYKAFVASKVAVYNKKTKEEKDKIYQKRKETLIKRGYKVTDETKKKLSEVQKGRVVKPETREKIRNTIKGQKYPIERVLKSELGRKKAREAKLKLLKLDLFNEEP